MIYVDIETCPGDPTHWRTRQLVARALGRDAWTPTEPDAVEAWSRTALDASAGRVMAIAYAVDDAEVEVTWAAPPSLLDDEGERGMLRILDDVERSQRAPWWCGHHVIGFDLPFLRRRSYVLGVDLGLRLPEGRYPRTVVDTMRMWSGDDPRDRVSLDDLCRILGVPGKQGASGAGAYLLAERDPDALRLYARADVARARSCHRRMTGRAPLARDLDLLRREADYLMTRETT